jgi:FMN-dependent oxidoreductase (nitrilotriacetate monooxygenase family)
VVLPVMAAATTRLGLGATLSTSFHTAYHLARWLGSLDAMSGGRVAWNVVTSATDLEAKNAGMDELPPRDQRYDRADEVLEACFALWNSWDPDALVRDKEAGIMSDPAKVHYANYEGRWIKTRGPLSIPRSPQGRPVIMQAGSSDRGREFAARWAEAIFTIQRGEADMREFYVDIKTRMQERGRPPTDCAILPAVSVVLGETESIAHERADYLNSLIDPELSLASSSSNLGADLTKLGAGKTLEELQGNQGMQGSMDVLTQVMKADKLSFKQAAVKRVEGREIIGTAKMVADRLQEVFESGVCDGFVLTPTMFPGMFEQFCRSVVPELQRRGLFRREYAGRTLRENLCS